ncbi:MAG: Cocaine esterase [Verrucomicrobiae bacterium]|nr:Cocaine esterase [Verrucomicrobiae bacterium]
MSKRTNQPACEARVILGARIPMRDGVGLVGDVYLPPPEGRTWPVVLSMSPYDATSGRSVGGLAWVKREFAFVAVDCRGRFKSEGQFALWAELIPDAQDVLDWITAQPWCDGNIGMVGGSYCAATQLAAVCSRHPALKAAAPSAITSDIYSIYYTHGALALAFMPAWHIAMTTQAKPRTPPDWEALLATVPLVDLDDRATLPSPSWKEVVEHPGRDVFWQALSFQGRLGGSQAGLFLQNGWFDNIGTGVFAMFNELPSARTCLRVGPWGHGVNVKEGDIDYGPAAIVTETAEIDFLTAQLRGQTPVAPRLEIFVMGDNEWRCENEWPLQRTRWTPLYLGPAGSLSWNKAAASQPDTFTYDPQNPVPTWGGRGVGRSGQREQTEIEKRPDVLVYTLPALPDDLEVTGPVTLTLFAASSARDTDFTVKLVDVFPDGRSFNVCDGILRARFRGGVDQPPELLVPGQVYELTIDVDVTAYVFKRGHGIRVQISSSNFPHYSRNPNTGNPLATDTEMQLAVQTIHHSAEHPSCLVLPVISRPTTRKNS